MKIDLNIGAEIDRRSENISYMVFYILSKGWVLTEEDSDSDWCMVDAKDNHKIFYTKENCEHEILHYNKKTCEYQQKSTKLFLLDDAYYAETKENKNV